MPQLELTASIIGEDLIQSYIKIDKYKNSSNQQPILECLRDLIDEKLERHIHDDKQNLFEINFKIMTRPHDLRFTYNFKRSCFKKFIKDITKYFKLNNEIDNHSYLCIIKIIYQNDFKNHQLKINDDIEIVLKQRFDQDISAIFRVFKHESTRPYLQELIEEIFNLFFDDCTQHWFYRYENNIKVDLCDYLYQYIPKHIIFNLTVINDNDEEINYYKAIEDKKSLIDIAQYIKTTLYEISKNRSEELLTFVFKTRYCN